MMDYTIQSGCITFLPMRHFLLELFAIRCISICVFILRFGPYDYIRLKLFSILLGSDSSHILPSAFLCFESSNGLPVINPLSTASG